MQWDGSLPTSNGVQFCKIQQVVIQRVTLSKVLETIKSWKKPNDSHRWHSEWLHSHMADLSPTWIK